MKMFRAYKGKRYTGEPVMSDAEWDRQCELIELFYKPVPSYPECEEQKYNSVPHGYMAMSAAGFIRP